MRLSSPSTIGLIRLLRAILNRLPSSVVLRISSRLGRWIGMFLPRERRIARGQMEYVRRALSDEPGRSDFTDALRNRLAHPDELIDEVFTHAGESLGEVLLLDRVLRQFQAAGRQGRAVPWVFSCTSSGQEIVDELIARKQGAVALSGHIGCFELLAAYHVLQGTPLSVVGRIPNDAGIDRLLREVRQQYGVKTIWRDEADSARKLIQVLRAGEIVAALIDQDTALESLYSPFFSLPAATPRGLIKLALRTELPILTSFIVRIERCHHHVITERILYEPEDPDAPQQILDEFHRRLEALIARYPEQWIWWHRRWRRRPDTDYEVHPDLLRSTDGYLAWLKSDAPAEAKL